MNFFIFFRDYKAKVNQVYCHCKKKKKRLPLTGIVSSPPLDNFNEKDDLENLPISMIFMEDRRNTKLLAYVSFLANTLL